MTSEIRRTICRIKFRALADDSSEDMRKNRPLPNVLIIGQKEALLETHFGVGAD